MEPFTIEASRIGLPNTASGKEIMDTIYSLQDRCVLAEKNAARWQEQAEKNQADCVAMRKDVEEKKTLEAEMYIGEAHRRRKFDANLIPHYVQLYKSDKPLCIKMVEAMRERFYWDTQESLAGPLGEPPIDVKAEVDGRANEKIAEATARGVKLTMAQAQQLVFNEDKDLKTRWDDLFVQGRKTAAPASEGGR